MKDKLVHTLQIMLMLSKPFYYFGSRIHVAWVSLFQSIVVFLLFQYTLWVVSHSHQHCKWSQEWCEISPSWPSALWRVLNWEEPFKNVNWTSELEKIVNTCWEEACLIVIPSAKCILLHGVPEPISFQPQLLQDQPMLPPHAFKIPWFCMPCKNGATHPSPGRHSVSGTSSIFSNRFCFSHSIGPLTVSFSLPCAGPRGSMHAPHPVV